MRPLVCLHGFTGSPAAWDAVLAALPEDARALCPAIAGHHPDLPLAARRFEHEVDRLAALMPQSGGLHLAGYSLGGRLALGLLVRHRQLFASATLIGAHPGLGGAAERRDRAAADDALARRLEREGTRAFVDRWQDLPLFATQSALPPEVLEAQRRRRLRHRPEGLAHALRVLSLGRMPDFRRHLPALDLPICLMAGEQDEKFRRLVEEMASALPRATIQVVPAAGHNLLLEVPRAVGNLFFEAEPEPGFLLGRFDSANAGESGDGDGKQ